jgi:glycosyltransferase involved in cell wall biosynthesis
MACGVPVITSNVTSLPEVAGEAALLFDPLDAGQLSQHMHTITSDKVMRDRLIQSGFQRKLLFSWDKSAEEVYAILKRFGR